MSACMHVLTHTILSVRLFPSFCLCLTECVFASNNVHTHIHRGSDSERKHIAAWRPGPRPRGGAGGAGSVTEGPSNANKAEDGIPGGKAAPARYPNGAAAAHGSDARGFCSCSCPPSSGRPGPLMQARCRQAEARNHPSERNCAWSVGAHTRAAGGWRGITEPRFYFFLECAPRKMRTE